MLSELKNIAVGTRYLLSQADLQFCIRIGKERYFNNRKANIREQKYTTNKSGVDLSVQGVIGEYGMMELFGIEKALLHNTKPNSRSQDRGDMVYKGLKIDVKCPQGHYCPLQTRAENLYHQSDLYLLCTMERLQKTSASTAPIVEEQCTYQETEPIEVIFQGCIAASRLFVRDKFSTRWGKQFYIAPRVELVSLEDAYQQLNNVCNSQNLVQSQDTTTEPAGSPTSKKRRTSGDGNFSSNTQYTSLEPQKPLLASSEMVYSLPDRASLPVSGKRKRETVQNLEQNSDINLAATATCEKI
jgi:hypothetical protein